MTSNLAHAPGPGDTVVLPLGSLRSETNPQILGAISFGVISRMKRFGLIVGGFFGFVCAIGFASLLWAYICGGAGLQILGMAIRFPGPPISSGSILIGLVHVVGFATASLLCFSIGAVFCTRGVVGGEALPQDRTSGRKSTARSLDRHGVTPSIRGVSSAAR